MKNIKDANVVSRSLVSNPTVCLFYIRKYSNIPLYILI